LQDEDMPLPGTGDDNEEQMFESAQGMLNGVRNENDMEMQDDTGMGQTGNVNAQPQTATSNEPRKPNKVRITTPYLTKYERARILGTRALQIR
jgi:DNA-directed RNA polymerases I, II, and III subunit RPABC2